MLHCLCVDCWLCSVYGVKLTQQLRRGNKRGYIIAALCADSVSTCIVWFTSIRSEATTQENSICNAMSVSTCHNNLNFIQPKYLRIPWFSAMSVTALAHGHWRPAANHCQDETTKYRQVEWEAHYITPLHGLALLWQPCSIGKHQHQALKVFTGTGSSRCDMVQPPGALFTARTWEILYRKNVVLSKNLLEMMEIGGERRADQLQYEVKLRSFFKDVCVWAEWWGCGFFWPDLLLNALVCMF